MAHNTVRQLKEEILENSEKKIRLYNPDSEDFTVLYAGIPHTLRSREIESFDYVIAGHIKKHLIDHLINKRNLVPYSPDVRDKLAKEIEVEL